MKLFPVFFRFRDSSMLHRFISRANLIKVEDIYLYKRFMIVSKSYSNTRLKSSLHLATKTTPTIKLQLNLTHSRYCSSQKDTFNLKEDLSFENTDSINALKLDQEMEKEIPTDAQELSVDGLQLTKSALKKQQKQQEKDAKKKEVSDRLAAEKMTREAADPVNEYNNLLIVRMFLCRGMVAFQ